MSNSKWTQKQGDSPPAPLTENEFHVCHNSRVSVARHVIVPNVSLFTDMEGNSYSVNMPKNFLRYKRAEVLFPNIAVHSVNICSESACNSDNLSEFEMSCNSNHSRFIQEMEDMRCKINETYVDHYRIPDICITAMFR